MRDGHRGHEVFGAARRRHPHVWAASRSPRRHATLLDVAPELTPARARRAVEQAQIKRLVTKRPSAGAIDLAPRPRRRRSAARAARRARLHAVAGGATARRAAARRRLPPPVFNARAEGFEVDVLWRQERVVLEFDSYAFQPTGGVRARPPNAPPRSRVGATSVLRTTWRELNEADLRPRRPHRGGAGALRGPALARARHASSARGGPSRRACERRCARACAPSRR